jgi:hypothetical protein
MIYINGSAEHLEIGERKSYIMTNEVYNLNEFWKYGIGCTAIMGFIAYNHGYFTALSPKKEA